MWVLGGEGDVVFRRSLHNVSPLRGLFRVSLCDDPLSAVACSYKRVPNAVKVVQTMEIP